MKLYLVYRQGVYMQGIVGVFSSMDLAEDARHAAKKRERDDYHSFEIEEFTLDEVEKLDVSGAW